MNVAVVLAVRGALEATVATTLAGDPRTTVVRRCADLASVLGAAQGGLATVVVLSADLPELDRPAVALLHELGVRVVAVGTGAPREDERLAALGVDAVLDPGPDGDVPELVSRVLDVAARPVGTGPGAAAGAAGAGVDDAFSDLAARSGLDADGPAHDGVVVAVWGPTGAPGRTTVAVNLATELTGAAARGRRRRTAAPADELTVLLADADTYGGAVAQQLGLLDESSGLAAAARAAGTGVLDDVALARLSPVVTERLRVLTGIARPSRWTELPGPALDVVWERAREVADVVVVDCGFSLERDEMLTYDTHAPQRNAATWSALGAADVVVVVGAAGPVGTARLVRALAELDDAGLDATRVVVVNRARASVGGRRPAAAARDVLERHAGATDVQVLPDDPASCDRALLEGRSLAECAPGSPVRAALAGTLDVVRAAWRERRGAPAAAEEIEGAGAPARGRLAGSR